MAVFDRGDVLSVTLDPAIGHGQRGTRPARVLTTKEFNSLGDVLIAPITQGGEFSRYAGFAVRLMGTGCKTQGVALLNKIRMLDLNARKARKVEGAPQAALDDALSRLTALLDGLVCLLSIPLAICVKSAGTSLLS
jgi:mRNA interferase ChpB